MNVIFLHRSPFFLAGALFLAACSGSDSGSGSDFSKTPDITITGRLNDTGILLCSNNEATELACPQEGFPLQDAEVGRDKLAADQQLEKQGSGFAGFDWSKIDNSGNLLAIQNAAWNDNGSEHSGSRWSCVLDNVTELMWEVKESDPSHPRYAEHTYTWSDQRAAYNGGNPGAVNGGTCVTTTCDTEGYVNWVNSNGLCGHNDWRMPTVLELASIAVLAKVIPAMDTDVFPNTKQPRFFTAQTNAKDPNSAWYVYFSDGSVSSTNKTDPSHVRLVRGGQQ